VRWLLAVAWGWPALQVLSDMAPRRRDFVSNPRWLGLGALLITVACTPPPACPKGTLRVVPASVFTTEQRLTEVSMTFPAPKGCDLPEGTFVVTGSFIEEDGSSRPLTVNIQRHDKSAGTALVTVSFTPSLPGIGTLKVFVDPQLGIVQLPVFVARDGATLPSFVELSCPLGQPSLTGHFVCADAGVSVRFQGTEVASMPTADAPQVVGNLLWVSVKSGANSVIERSLLLPDGGVQLLERSPPFRPGTTHARYADEERTFRDQVVAIARDGGMEVIPQGAVASAVDAVVAEPGRAWVWNTDRWCQSDGGCQGNVTRARIAGLERDAWWEYVSPTLTLRPRPVGDAGSLATVELTTGLSVLINRRDVQRTFRPTWPDTDQTNLVLERTDAGGLFFTRLPEGPVRFQNDEFIGLGVDGGTRFFRLR